MRFPFAWIDVGRGRLALTHRPRMRWLPNLKGSGCDRVVTILSAAEGAAAIGEGVHREGLAWTWIDLATGRPPQGNQSRMVIAHVVSLSAYLDRGESILIHCSAGMHRTGMVALALLRHRGMSESEAWDTVARLRPQTAAGLGPAHLDWVAGHFEAS